ncbi:hypothetical protein [Cryobacterium cryoconiti]|uniref:Uncharacterized protein n=1 Tax=Cryobacterium cryoconiti TaxID=1259239 RepID=A0A4Y8JY31_9MICO|nr:hypothetical protein [Cryobacterium cryoconiti]TFD27505.1 hypothetical protein E3T49_13265 [Cryobacterium cryoconiti]
MSARARRQTRRLRMAGLSPAVHNEFVALRTDRRQGGLARLAVRALGRPTSTRAAATLYTIFNTGPAAAEARIPHETPRVAQAITTILQVNAVVTARLQAQKTALDTAIARQTIYAPNTHVHHYTTPNPHELMPPHTPTRRTTALAADKARR